MFNQLGKRLAVMGAICLFAFVARPALGETGQCSQCGCGKQVRRVCRPLVTTRAVKVNGWGVVEEEIAVPRVARALRCNCPKAGACCTTGRCMECLTGSCLACCKVRPRNRLMRKTYLEYVPTVVWTVEYVCGDCAATGAKAMRGSSRAVSMMNGPPLAGRNEQDTVPSGPAAFASDQTREKKQDFHRPLSPEVLLNTLRGSLRR